MKRLKQHKSFIYHGDNLLHNKESILNDISDLLNIPVSEVYTSEDVREFDCSGLKVDDWDEVYENFIFNPTGDFKIVVFDNAQKLSERLQNKLLKPIETNEENIKVIFNTTSNLLDTICSRSMTIRLVSQISNSYPDGINELQKFFGVEEVSGNEDLISSIIRLENAIVSNKSLIIESGLIKEKNKHLKFFSTKLEEISKLIILHDIDRGVVTKRSRIASRYLEVESDESNLYLLLLELEIN